MVYVGIDIGKKRHTCAVIGPAGEVLVKPFVFSARLSGYEKLLTVLKPYRDDSQLGFEATGHYWLPLYERLNAAGFEPLVLNPLQVSSFRNQGIRGTKTDTCDALLIGRILRYGVKLEMQQPEDRLVSLKELTRYRADLSGQLSSVTRRLIAVLDRVFPEYQGIMNNVLCRSSRALLTVAPLPDDLKEIDLRKLARLLKKASWGTFSTDKARELKQAAQQSFGIKIARDTFQFQIRQIVAQAEQLKAHIKEIDEKIAQLVRELNTPLTSITGIDTLTAGVILAEVGSIERFQHPKGGATALVAFAGMDPRLTESGTSRGRSRMSKRGSPHLRRAVYWASFVAARRDPMFREIYQRHKDRGKHHTVTLSHVANKMLHVIYSVMKNNKPYRPVIGKEKEEPAISVRSLPLPV